LAQDISSMILTDHNFLQKEEEMVVDKGILRGFQAGDTGPSYAEICKRPYYRSNCC
jgi:hypothetical protein